MDNLYWSTGCCNRCELNNIGNKNGYCFKVFWEDFAALFQLLCNNPLYVKQRKTKDITIKNGEAFSKLST